MSRSSAAFLRSTARSTTPSGESVIPSPISCSMLFVIYLFLHLPFLVPYIDPPYFFLLPPFCVLITPSYVVGFSEMAWDAVQEAGNTMSYAELRKLCMDKVII